MGFSFTTLSSRQTCHLGPPVARPFFSTAVSLGLFLSLAGCSDAGASDASGEVDDDEPVAQLGRALIGGATSVTTGDATSESEAVIAISTEPNGQIHSIVTANADDSANIVYDDGGTPADGSDDTRQVFVGASMMEIYHKFGLTGEYSSTRLRIAGVGLWGDPAITAAGQYAYATSLRIPHREFVLSGTGDIVVPITNTGGEGMGDHLAGACVARSSNYGQTWALGAGDCVDDNGHFYDGSSVAAHTDGKFFIAFNDVDASQVDVWQAPGPTSALSLMANPFPALSIASHPRLKYRNSILYVMSIDSSDRLWLNRYVSGTWQTPVLASSGLSYHETFTTADSKTIRLGPGFDFSVYSSPFDGSAQVVFVHTTRIGGKLVLKTGSCNASSGTWSCGVSPETSNPAVHCFNPAIETGWYSPAPGVTVPSTKVTYQRMNGDNIRLALHASPFGFTSAAVRVTNWQRPCPDYRGYWGDYDSMAVGSDGFHRVFSDSTASGTCTQQEYTQHPLGVSEAVIPIPP